MRRINARIDGLLEKQNRGAVLISQLRELLSSPLRVAFAAQSVLLLILAGVLLWPQPDAPAFTTLTNSQQLPAGEYVRVVFDPRSETQDHDVLLDRLQLTIVDGPSERGVATLRVNAAISDTQRNDLLAELLSDPDILFAAPVTTGEQR